MIKRPLMWMAVVFIMGDLFGLSRQPLLPAAAALLCIAAILYCLLVEDGQYRLVRKAGKDCARYDGMSAGAGMKLRRVLLLLLIPAVFLSGMFRAETALQNRIRVLSGIDGEQSYTLQGTIVKKEWQREQLVCRLEKVFIKKAHSSEIVQCGDVRIILPSDFYPMGTTLILDGKLNQFDKARNEGAFDQRQYYNSQGIWMEMYKPQVCGAYGPKGDNRMGADPDLTASTGRMLVMCPAAGALSQPKTCSRGGTLRQAGTLGRTETLSQLKAHSRDGMLNQPGMRSRIGTLGQEGTHSWVGSLGQTAEALDYGMREWLYRMRCHLGEVLDRLMSESNAGVLRGMLLGDKSRMDADTKLAYRNAGISHILAISALHISIFAMGLYRFLRKRRKSFLTAGVISAEVILCYGIMTGYSVSTGRAITMFVIMTMGAVAGRGYDMLSALGAWVLLALWENPFLPEYSGFVFSVTAVLGIGVTVKIIETTQPSKGRGIKSAFVSGAGIQLTTLPLVALYYYEIPTYAVFLNLLVIPLMSVVLGSGAIGVLAGCVWLPLGKVAALPAGWILSAYRWLCDRSLRLPLALIITGKPGLWELLAYYGLLAATLAGLRRRQKRVEQSWEVIECGGGAADEGAGGGVISGDAAGGSGGSTASLNAAGGADGSVESGTEVGEPGRSAAFRNAAGEEGGSVVSGGFRHMVSAIVVVSTLLTLLYHPRPLSREVVFLDVGQGMGIYFATEDGHHIFMDGGSTSDKNVGTYQILPFLKARGIRQIDFWCISHGDEDHISGAIEVFESGYGVKNLVLAEAMPKDDAWKRLVDAAKSNGSTVMSMRAGQKLVMGEESLECIFPGKKLPETAYESKEDGDGQEGGMGSVDRNKACLVLVFHGKEYSALFPGDISSEEEELILKEGRASKTDIYAAAHHGSRFSNSTALLQAIRPGISVMSAGKNNRYGHPSKETLERLEEEGLSYIGTIENGEIVVKPEDGGIKVRMPCK